MKKTLQKLLLAIIYVIAFLFLLSLLLGVGPLWIFFKNTPFGLWIGGICAVVGFFYPLLAWSAQAVKRDKQSKSAAAHLQFYQECLKFKITSQADLKQPQISQRLELLAKKHKLPYTDLSELLGLLKEQEKMADQKAQQEQERSLEQKKMAEAREFDALTFYAGLHGHDKPAAMINDLRAKKLSEADGTSFIPTRKISDGAVMAGIASGIGGTVPALMSLQNTAQSNTNAARINEAIDAHNALRAQVAIDLRKNAQRWRKTGDCIAAKLCADLSCDEVFQHLTFTEPVVHISETGTLSVTTDVTASDIDVYGNPGFADGSVIAEIYDGKKKIADAVMVFPVFGSDSGRFYRSKEGEYSPTLIRDPRPAVSLKGMALFCGQAGISYRINLIPGDLWAMERITDTEVKSFLY